MSAYHVIIADDHPLFRDALKQTLATSLPGIAHHRGRLGRKAARCARRRSAGADLVLLDLKMPGEKGAASLSGLTGLMYLRSQHPEIPVVIVSASDNQSMIRRCANLGAAGFISKSLPVDQIRQAVKTILEGGVWFSDDMQRDGKGDELGDLATRLATLTPQQVRVLSMLGQGLLNKQIAYRIERLRSDGQSACVRDPSEARRRQPHASRDRRQPDSSAVDEHAGELGQA